MPQPLRAIFLDRDGTLNVDHGYVCEIDQFQFIDGVIDACIQLNKMGFILVLVTNQSGIARGKFTEKAFLQLTEWMDWSLADRGVDLAGIYYCPHHPEEGQGEYLQVCNCRKPKPGMIIAAKNEFNIDLTASYIIGDKIEDLQAGLAAGIGTTVLVKSGKPITDEGISLADWVLDSLIDLPEKISKTKK